jgi:hypothetical protein
MITDNITRRLPAACCAPLKTKFMQARYRPKMAERIGTVLEMAFEHGNCTQIEYITEKSLA